MIYYEDKKYKFFELFNEKNGTLIRSDISGTQMNATMRSFSGTFGYRNNGTM